MISVDSLAASRVAAPRQRTIRLAACVATFLLTGCATGARSFAMLVQPVVTRSPHAVTIELDSVIGGKATNPIGLSNVSDEAMAEALRSSLLAAGFGEASRDTARLRVSLLTLGGPGTMGHGVTVRASVHYQLFLDGTASPVLDSTITTEAISPLRRSLWGPTRRRIAVEHALQENFAQFLELLQSMKAIDSSSTGAKKHGSHL